MNNEMTELPINQKEYLKKYLGIGKAPGEKRKKKKKPTANRVQIIDDDADITIPTNDTIDDDVLLVNEDAPQIVAIIDERPPSMRVDEKTKNPLWQPIGVVDDNKQALQKQLIKGFKIQPKSNDKPLASRDSSPPRRRKRVDNGVSASEKSNSNNFLADIVIKEERRSVSPDDSSSRRNKSAERDVSPPRRGRSQVKQDDDISPPRRRKNVQGDLSPPRKGKEQEVNKSRSNYVDDDASPPRRSRNVEDLSPPRRGKEGKSKSRWENDSSPPRKRNRDFSPPRRSRDLRDDGKTRSKYDDRRNRKVEIDLLPERKSREADRSRSRFDDSSPPRKNKKTESSPRRKDSPPRKSRKEENNKSSSDEKTVQNQKSSKHGLMDASKLVQETRDLQTQQENLFNSLSEEASGQNSQTVYRDRQTGKIRNLQEEEEKQRKKQEEEEKNKEKYARWGRGLAQVESHTQKLQEQLHEMSKPLARYADDEDLEKYLKEQERDGDPMLAYIRKKKRKKAAEAGEVIKPQFEGEFMPNRYGIRPGHRWDGVDRSNGYEKKWFEVQNEKKALREDSYKWSTEDM